MNKRLKDLLRPVYHTLVKRNPVMQAVIRHETTERFADAVCEDFVDGNYGSDYGVTRAERLQFVADFAKVVQGVQSATGMLSHVVLAREILSIPRSVPGDVIECGVFKGASSCSLSLVCRRVGRKMLVCDSFEGLPDEGLQLHTAPHFGIYGYYQKGMFCGRLDEVKGNIAAFGAPEVCEFVVGFFCDSLPALKDPIAFAFLDVDLVSSTQDCLRHVWPLLSPGGSVFTDDAGDLACCKVFFDDPWWHATLGCDAPGFVGSGCGLPLSPTYSSIGYARKPVAPEAGLQRASHLFYPDGPAGEPGSGKNG